MEDLDQDKIRRFEAPSIFEAYTKLKKELGEEAVILNTRTYKKGGVMGLWGQNMVEIIASASMPKNVGKKKAAGKVNSPARRAYGVEEKTVKPAYSRSVGAGTVMAPERPQESVSQFRSELAEIRAMVEEIHDSGRHVHWADLPREFAKAFEKLQGFNIHEDISRALVHRWKSHYGNYKKGDRVDVSLLLNYVEEMIVPGGPILIKTEKKPTTVMLIGATGVGKTTTLAKLAARYKIREGLSVALITIDTYRIAAVEQLRTYADLIGVPLKVVDTPGDLETAIQSFSHCDLILIDTAGRSPKNSPRMDDLKEFVDRADVDELHLVLSLTLNNEVMRDTMERFASFPVKKLLLTKLDEAVHYGIILSVISKTQKPIGYVTVGQEVPDDMEVADGKKLARMILGLDKIHG